jgi:tetratricopeptide (TPR) repeat protein
MAVSVNTNPPRSSSGPSSFSVLALASTVLCVGLIAALQWPRSDLSKRTDRVLTAPPILPKAEAIKPFLFGMDNLVADWYWLQYVQYFGDGVARKKTNFDYCDDYLELITALDPKFVKAYAAASYAVAGMQDNPDKALQILARGIKLNPATEGSWELYRNYAGVAFLYKKDLPTAAKYFAKAADAPGAPEVFRSFAAAFYNRMNDKERAVSLWVQYYREAPTQELKDKTKKNLIDLGVWFREWGADASIPAKTKILCSNQSPCRPLNR